MTETVPQLLDTFDALPEVDKHQVTIEILRRYGGALEEDLSEATLVEAADHLFRVLEEEENGHAPR